MARIRKLYYFDKPKVKKMISFLGNDAMDQFTKVLMNDPFGIIHYALPLKFKFLPESYVLIDDKETRGMITVSPTHGNPFKLDITRLFFDQNYYNVGKQLLEFVIARYGAKGATSFNVAIDECHDELLHLFTDGCGFRQCSSEQLWKMNSIHFEKCENSFFRPFKNSDAQAVAMLFNDSVIPHFRPYLAKMKNEYNEANFQGLSSASKFRYVMEDKSTNTILAYCSITTFDNLNYILDITTSAWYDLSYDDIFNFAINQISRRKKEFYLFVKSKKYTNTAEQFENYLNEKDFKCVQNQIILVKDFYRVIKETAPSSQRVVLFSEATGRPAFKISQDVH